jgi:hypothetical protein
MDIDYPRAKLQVGIDENIVKRKNKGKKDDLVMSILQELSLAFSLVSRSACKGQRVALPRRQKQLGVGRKHS